MVIVVYTNLNNIKTLLLNIKTTKLFFNSKFQIISRHNTFSTNARYVTFQDNFFLFLNIFTCFATTDVLIDTLCFVTFYLLHLPHLLSLPFSTATTNGDHSTSFDWRQQNGDGRQQRQNHSFHQDRGREWFWDFEIALHFLL